MRRLLMFVSVAFALAVGHIAAVASQEATPPPDIGLAGLGLPELHITLADDAIQVPDQVEGGRVLLVLENQLEFPDGVVLLQLPEGVSPEDLMAAFAPPVVATPEIEEDMPEPMPEAIPDFMYDATWAGGVAAFPGEQAQIVITLTPGEWVILPDLESPLAPAVLTVTEEVAPPVDEITADATIELDNFQILMPDQLEAGPQIWGITNIGDQPHEIFIAETPVRLTVEQVELLLTIPEDEPLPPELPDEEEFVPAAFVFPFSGDQTVWAEIDLAPGHYIALCFFPDRETGEPHAFLGMVVSFSIGEPGEVVEPPASPVPQEHTDM